MVSSDATRRFDSVVNLTCVKYALLLPYFSTYLLHLALHTKLHTARVLFDYSNFFFSTKIRLANSSMASLKIAQETAAYGAYPQSLLL